LPTRSDSHAVAWARRNIGRRQQLAPRPVAVGTPITERPPHKSGRAAFPHTASTSGIDGGPRRVPPVCMPANEDTLVPVLRPVREGWHTFPLASALRSADSAADRSALFAGFTATMASSDFPRPCIIGYGSSPSRCGPGACANRPDAGSPSFRRDLSARDVLFDPGGANRTSQHPTFGTARVAFGSKDNLRPHDKGISWLNHTPHAAAVYALWPPLPSAYATLASRGLAYLGWTCTRRSRQPPGAFPLPTLTTPSFLVKQRRQSLKHLAPSPRCPGGV
jgi:hypothetical protein